MSARGSVYLDQIAKVRSPEKAATLIRALATTTAASLFCTPLAERIEIIEKAEQRAQSLERPWSSDGDGADGDKKPWRKWLREWGYVR